MSGQRFDPLPLIWGHWKSIINAEFERYQPDWLARGLLAVTPVGLFIASLVDDWSIKTPTALLSGMALFSGALLSAFGSLSSLRLRLTSDWAAPDDENTQPARDMIDETVAHLLTAALASAATAVALVIGTNNLDKSGHIGGVMGAVIVALGGYVALLFFLVVPRLYSAYVLINKVRDKFNGFVRGIR
jgi:hypothetical protein